MKAKAIQIFEPKDHGVALRVVRTFPDGYMSFSAVRIYKKAGFSVGSGSTTVRRRKGDRLISVKAAAKKYPILKDWLSAI